MPRFSAVGKAIYYPIKPNGKQGKGQLLKEVIMYCDHDDQAKKIDTEFANNSESYKFVKSGKKEYKLYFPLELDDREISIECRKLSNIALHTPHLYSALSSEEKK